MVLIVFLSHLGYLLSVPLNIYIVSYTCTYVKSYLKKLSNFSKQNARLCKGEHPHVERRKKK